MTAPGPPPAGWYPDPSGAEGRRYWDGAAWTAYTEDLYRPGGPYGSPMPDVGSFLAQSLAAAGRALVAVLPHLLVLGGVLAVLGIATVGVSDLDEWWADAVEVVQDTPVDEEPVFPDLPALHGPELALLGLTALVAVLGAAGLVVAAVPPADDTVRGDPPTLDRVGDVVRAVGRLVVVLLAAGAVVVSGSIAALLFAAAGWVGLIAAVAGLGWLVWVGVRMSLVVPIVVLDGLATAAFRRSFELTRGWFWAIVGRGLLLSVVVGVSSMVVSLPLQVVFAGDSGPILVVNLALSFVVQAGAYVASVAGLVVLRHRLASSAGMLVT